MPSQERVLLSLAKAHSLPSVRKPAEGGSVPFPKHEILGALGGIRTDHRDIGPELLQIEAGIPTDVEPVIARLAVLAYDELMDQYLRRGEYIREGGYGKPKDAPHWSVVRYAAQVAILEWVGPRSARRTPEEHRKACRTRASRMLDALNMCERLRGMLRDEAMWSIQSQLSEEDS